MAQVQVPVIYLGLSSQIASICLPSKASCDMGRATLITLVYMTFQPARFTPLLVAKSRRALLPHDFTLTSRGRRFVSVALAVTRSFPKKYPPVRWRGALRCPDFPHPAKAGRDGPGLVFPAAKVVLYWTSFAFWQLTF